MTSRPRLLALLSILLAAVGLAACGGTSEPSATTAAPPTTAAPTRAVSRDTAPAYVPSGEGVHVTSVVKAGTVYEIVLNGVIRVPNVRIIDGTKGKFLGFPQREADGHRFDYVYIDSTANPGLVAEVEGGHGVQGNKGFTITKAEVHRLDTGGKKKAFVTFFLNDGAVKLYSWSLIEGERGLWLAAPSEKAGNDFADVVEASDRDFKKALENAAIEAFDRG